jgi:hypothetical protein
LLAAQGTADTTINNPRNTDVFFAAAHRPKYVLRLFGAPHLRPYTGEQPQLSIVERVAIDVLDHYLRGAPAGVARMKRAGNRPDVASLVAQP